MQGAQPSSKVRYLIECGLLVARLSDDGDRGQTAHRPAASGNKPLAGTESFEHQSHEKRHDRSDSRTA